LKRIGVKELKEQASEVVRAVRETGASYDVTYRGRVVARIVPADVEETDEEIERWIDEWADLARRISEAAPGPVSAVDLVREQRRDL
jgi:prevent-host-death family protein